MERITSQNAINLLPILHRRKIFLQAALAYLINDFCFMTKSNSAEVMRSLQARFYSDLTAHGWDEVNSNSKVKLNAFVDRKDIYQDLDSL